MSREKKDSNDPSLLFKEKEKGSEGRSPNGGQWKEKEKVPMLGGQWNVPSLVANGRRRKNHFHLFPLSPQPILLKPSIFPFDLKVLLYCGSRPLFTHFLPFPWLINYDRLF